MATSTRSRRARLARFGIEVDPRTNAMSVEVLTCRRMNHAWDRVPQGHHRRQELYADGQTEAVWRCLRCDSVRSEVFELRTGALVRSPKIQYSERYLIPSEYRGQGRLTRNEIRKAMIASDG